MGLFGALMNIGKARIAGRLLRRGLGANVGTLLMVAWAGKKLYEMNRSRRQPKMLHQ